MGCTPIGMRIPESEQYRWGNKWEDYHQKDNGPFVSIQDKDEKALMPPNFITQASLAASRASAMDLFQSSVKTEQQDVDLDRSKRALGFTLGAQASVMPPSQIFFTQMNPVAMQTPVKDAYKPFFESPIFSHQTLAKPSDKARRVLDFSAGVGEQQLWEPSTTTAQETVNYLKEKKKEEEREAEKQLQARKDRMRADLQQKIHTREQKKVEVRSSVKTCEGFLEAEWLEIYNAFSEVMRVVDDARRKALEPLEKRKQKMKREAQDLEQKLQREIDRLKESMNELDNKPDLKVPGLGEPSDWKNVSVDTSLSFGTLRVTTSTMVKEIQQKLENLSSLEIKRIPTFEVDVKLDSATAHQCLVLSGDLKTVQDGGEKPKVPDAPESFDVFGSVLGLNSLTSGKSYWEVEVNNKTGWDLGVARRSANRKGVLDVNTENGYWVAVHYGGKKYAALTVPPVSLPLRVKPQKVGVFVDHDEGLVSFYDVKTQSHIYSFTECSFGGEIVPYFSPHLKENGRNADPLIISAVRKQ
ncbi:uncharacterized protein PAE49_021236 isoform 2-T2 [Odontesthes bonariensis]